MHLFLKKIYRKNPFPKIYRINQCEVLNKYFFMFKTNFEKNHSSPILGRDKCSWLSK